MPEDFSDLILKNWSQLQNIFNNVQDVIVQDNYKDAYKQLEPFRQEKNNRDKFYAIADKLSGVDYNNIPIVKEDVTEGIDPESYSIAGLGDTDSYKRFVDLYFRKNPDADKTKPIDINEYNKYLSEFPADRDELRAKGILKPMKVQVKKNEDEILNDIYTKAGLTPEDVDFYKQYSNKIKQEMEAHNNRLAQFINQWSPYLVSEGNQKDTNLKRLEYEASLLGTQAPKPIDYQWRTVGGSLVKINPLNGQYTVIPVKQETEKKKGLKDLSASQLRKLSYDDIINNFSTDEIYQRLYDFPKEVQDKLFETFPDWKQEETSKSSRSGRIRIGTGRGNNPFGDLFGDEDEEQTETTEIESPIVREALKKNAERIKDYKNNPKKYASKRQQREEFANYLGTFKEMYDTINKVKDVNSGEYLKAREIWYNMLIDMMKDASKKFDADIVEEAEKYIEKYFDIGIDYGR